MISSHRQGIWQIPEKPLPIMNDWVDFAVDRLYGP